MEKFGFDQSRKGVAQSAALFTPEMNAHPFISQQNELMLYLISVDQQREVATRGTKPPAGISKYRAENPNPDDWIDDTEGKVWLVTGGGDKGGILVRAGESTTSAQLDKRISTGSL